MEHGIAWRKENNGDYLFIHKISGETDETARFDYGRFNENIDFRREFNWVKWDDFLNWMGQTYQEWILMPFGLKISDLINHYGYENIMGTSYWGGMSVEDLREIELN